MAEQAWKLVKNLVAKESVVIGKSLTEDDKSAVNISSHLLTNIVALEAVVSSSQEPLSETVEVMQYTVSKVWLQCLRWLRTTFMLTSLLRRRQNGL